MKAKQAVEKLGKVKFWLKEIPLIFYFLVLFILILLIYFAVYGFFFSEIYREIGDQQDFAKTADGIEIIILENKVVEFYGEMRPVIIVSIKLEYPAVIEYAVESESYSKSFTSDISTDTLERSIILPVSEQGKEFKISVSAIDLHGRKMTRTIEFRTKMEDIAAPTFAIR